MKPWFFLSFNIIISHIFPENFIGIPQVVQKMMSAALFHFQDTLNRLFNSFIYKVIFILEKFFFKYEGEVKLTPLPPQKKLPSKSPAILGLILANLLLRTELKPTLFDIVDFHTYFQKRI